jgi:DNA repair exonuclease SbcCD ATPase subunit
MRQVDMKDKKPNNPAQALINSIVGELNSESTKSQTIGMSRVANPTRPQFSNPENPLIHAENLRLSQQRITELEREIERLREENETLSSGHGSARQKLEEYEDKLVKLERERVEMHSQFETQIRIYKDSLEEKDKEMLKMRRRLDEAENRISLDLRKIRNRERELENRLELAKLEKNAVTRVKDETILELKAKLDQIQQDHEQNMFKNVELAKRVEAGQDQLNRTVRALRLALTNLEANDNTDLTLVPVKKAE